MNWADILKHEPVYLNIGGGTDCHPDPRYRNYVSVDQCGAGEWSVQHDLTKPIPLPNKSVAGILTEHFLEHLRIEDIGKLLGECHRILKPGGMMRIAVADYNNPRDRKYLRKGRDPRHSDHQTLVTYELLKTLIDESPFTRYKFLHYWDGDVFVRKPIDYSQGMVKRTPDNDPRCRRVGLRQHMIGILRDILFVISRGFVVSSVQMSVQRGHPLRTTSIVVDLYRGGIEG